MSAQSGDVLYAERMGIPGVLTVQDVLDLVPASGSGSGPAVGGYRATTAFDVNQSTTVMNIPWDDASDRREDTGISIDAAHEQVTVTGTPDHVELAATVKVAIDEGDSVQRPNSIIEIVRSDGRVIASSATGYIRDNDDHEETSYNLFGIDYSPIADASYRVTAVRETAKSGVVSMQTDKSQFTVRVFG